VTVITVNMHEHLWETVEYESGWRSCKCGFFREVMSDGTLREPSRIRLVELTDRINNRLDRAARERARSAGLYVPRGGLSTY
jgi:hypothetical protein